MTPKPQDSEQQGGRAKPWPLMFYAPGEYFCNCPGCGEVFQGDKRAVECLPCAAARVNEALIGQVNRIDELIKERNAYRTQAINRGWNWNMCNAYGRLEYERHLENEVDRTLEVMLGRKTLAESFRDEPPSPDHLHEGKNDDHL